MRIKTKDMILTALFSALMIAGAFIRIPFPLVPITFQPFFCALSGIILGARLGMLSQLIYLAVGLAGIPVFAGGGGFMYIYNPTFGFLLGFVLAAYIIGKISEKLESINIKTALFALIPGLIALFLVGISYFYLIKNLYLGQETSLAYVIPAVFLPVFVKDLVLYVIIAIIAVRIIPVMKKAGLKP